MGRRRRSKARRKHMAAIRKGSVIKAAIDKSKGGSVADQNRRGIGSQSTKGRYDSQTPKYKKYGMTWGRKKRGKRGYFSKLRDKARSRMKQQLKSRGGKLASKRRLDRRVKRGKSRILGGLKRPKNRVTDRKLNFTQRVEAGRKLSLKNLMIY